MQKIHVMIRGICMLRKRPIHAGKGGAAAPSPPPPLLFRFRCKGGVCTQGIRAAIINHSVIRTTCCRLMLLRKCLAGGTRPLRLEVVWLGVGTVVFRGRGRQGQSYKKSETVGTLLATTDSSIRQQHRTTFCTLKHTRRSCYRT